MDELARKIRDVAYLEGDFILSSGKRSKYYLDKYRFESQPEILREIAQRLAARIPPGTERIAGAELGAVPLAAAVALQTGLPFVIVRKEQKAHGTAKKVEGVLNAGESVVLVEDVLTSGAQALKAVQSLTDLKVKVVKILGVIDRQEGASDAIRYAGYDFEALFTSSDLGITPGK